MDSRRWWLLAAAVPVALGCALATVQPAFTLVGQLSVVVAGLLAATVLWGAAPRTSRPGAWRLLVIAPLLPVVGVLLTIAAGHRAPLTIALLRWAPAVPGYLVAIVAVLGLVDRRRLRAGGRVGVEIALFFAACTVVVGLLLVGPGDRWSSFGLTEQMVLGSAVLATSAIMAATLTLVGVVEAGRRSMAIVLLAGTVFLTLGRGLATSALLAGTPAVPAGLARGLMAGGLLLLAQAALVDSRSTGDAGDRLRGDHGVVVSTLLPHLALLAAVLAAGAVALRGERQNAATVVGLVSCVLLAAVHRWLSAREEQRLATGMRRSEAYFRSVVQSAADAVVILGDDLSVRWASPALDRALGDGSSALVGHPILEVVHPDDAPALDATLQGGDAPNGRLLTVRLPDAAGEWRYLEARVSDLRDVPDVGALVLHCRDMTDRYAREQALQSVAYTDPMTGLPNRAGFLELVREATAAEEPSTMLMVELENLAATREGAGREVVSAAVAEIGRRLRATVRGEDTVARMGGGAFAVLAAGSDDDADRLASRCLSVVEQPIVTPGGIVELTSGIGLVPIETGLDVEAVLARADLAARAAHEAGPGSAVRYADSLGDAAARRDRLRNDLRGARARDELFLLFQPIVSLSTQQVTGMEAQLRWRHPDLGEIPPSEFLPLAERAGLIGELLRWAVEETAGAAAALPERDEPLRIGLKIPFAYLETGAVVPDVDQALRRSGLAPGRLVLKINAPTVMSDSERVALDVASLRLLGVHVALDDFGSGSSALAHLTRLPIDIVTLDRSLITRIDRDPQSRALCESLIGIATALGLDVVATGVETPAQLAALCGFECGFAQGFLISRPLPLSGLLAATAPGALWPGLVGSR